MVLLLLIDDAAAAAAAALARRAVCLSYHNSQPPPRLLVSTMVSMDSLPSSSKYCLGVGSGPAFTMSSGMASGHGVRRDCASEEEDDDDGLQ